MGKNPDGAKRVEDGRIREGVLLDDAYRTSLAYVVRFYPRWFTYHQQQVPHTQLFGPLTMTPEFKEVNAPNVDTSYVTSFVDVTAEPAILRIPSTPVVYSLFTSDVYGNVFQTTIQPPAPGLYAIVGPGTPTRGIPRDATRVEVPVPFSVWIIRADNFGPSGDPQPVLVDEFRTGLQLAPLSAYLADPTGNHGRLVPVVLFGQPFKVIADNQIRESPTTFLLTLQRALADPTTPPPTGVARRLARRMDRFLRFLGDHPQDLPLRSAILEGVQDAHTAIVDRYLSHVGATQWIRFMDIGEWSSDLDRSATTEFLQYGNETSTAVYFHTFNDGHGHPLDCTNVPAYRLTFPADQIPEAKRFWSVTAYLPESITLIPNEVDKYSVGSYTEGLVRDADGSLTIYIQHRSPGPALHPNCLPCSADGPFNLMLRVYGPEGNVDQDYTPPAVEPSVRKFV